ncbi:MAG: type III-B CRISPR module RAMP protein Cmr4 [Candidatus Poribacteria bacterium]|nr:type III-B CRISPR module RAMP protein Cmr4 [Candidatus Poribacteria bacterium]
MFKQAKPLFLIVETPLHAGSGSDLGIVDLPIQREKHTDYPKIEASGLKGSIREIFRAQVEKPKVELVFGPEDGDLHAGALGFTDARLLLFPVKSVKGVFAWVTCPAALERFKHDLSICQPSVDFVENIPDANTVPNESSLIVKDEGDAKKIVLEEYTFTVTHNDGCDIVAKWIAHNVLPTNDPSYNYWCDKIEKDIVVLSDDDFRDFVMLSTEVIARTKIDSKKGTVVDGALWYEEYLPTDSILYSLALTTPLFIKIEDDDVERRREKEKDKKNIFYTSDEEVESRIEKAPDAKPSDGNGNERSEAIKSLIESEKVMNFFAGGLPDIIQIGGNATIGKGIVRTHVYQNQGGNDGTGSNDTQRN